MGVKSYDFKPYLIGLGQQLMKFKEVDLKVKKKHKLFTRLFIADKKLMETKRMQNYGRSINAKDHQVHATSY